MNDIRQKTRIVFLPFAVISVGFVVVYSLLNWVVVIECRLPIQDDLVNFWLPYALSWLPILIWLRPRLRVLSFKKDKSLFFFELVAALIIFVPTLIAQNYLEAATGRLTPVERVSEVRSVPPTKYYSIKLFYADKSRAKIEASLTGGGRSSIVATALFVVPLRDAIGDVQFNCDVWLVAKYKKELSQHDSATVEEQYREFVRNSPSQLNNEDFRSFSYWEKLGRNDDRRLAEAAIQQSNLNDSLHRPTILMGVHQSFESRNAGRLPWAFGILGAGSTLWVPDALVSANKRGGTQANKERSFLCRRIV